MKEERPGTPIQVGDVTITPIAEIRRRTVRWSQGVYVWGSIQPVAILIERNGHEERIELRAGADA